MAKKKVTKNKKNKTNKVISKDAKFLLTLIAYTERCVKNDGSNLDQVFMGQVDKLKKQLTSLK